MATRKKDRTTSAKSGLEWGDPILTVLEFEQQRLERLSRDIARECSTLPAGTISYKTIHGRRYFYHSPTDNTATEKLPQRYIGHDEAVLKEALWKKRHLVKTEALVTANKQAIDRMLKQYTPHSAWPIYSEIPTDQRKYQNRNTACAWERERYETNPYHPEGKIHITLGGLRVRSKSEALIAGILEAKKIPFRYEARLDLGNRYFYPDFTVLRKRDNAVFYWEHFGMLEDQNYAESAEEKLRAYRDNGLHPWNQLIITFDLENGSLNSQSIEALIHHMFR